MNNILYYVSVVGLSAIILTIVGMLFKSLLLIKQNSQIFKENNPFTIHLMLLMTLIQFCCFLFFLGYSAVVDQRAFNGQISIDRLSIEYLLAHLIQNVIMEVCLMIILYTLFGFTMTQ